MPLVGTAGTAAGTRTGTGGQSRESYKYEDRHWWAEQGKLQVWPIACSIYAYSLYMYVPRSSPPSIQHLYLHHPHRVKQQKSSKPQLNPHHRMVDPADGRKPFLPSQGQFTSVASCTNTTMSADGAPGPWPMGEQQRWCTRRLAALRLLGDRRQPVERKPIL